MMDFSRYVFSALREGDLTRYRGSGHGLSPILLVLAEDASPGSLQRLQHEYALKADIDAAWAARPVALSRYNDHSTLVLEDPGGAPLDQLLERRLGLVEFLHIAIPLARALRQMHERGLIHKDIKPENVLVDMARGGVWLTGFGIASRLPREHRAPEPSQVIAGTLAYMAPEQTGRMNRSIDSRSDLYALGVTFYEMLTGTLPFKATDPMGWVHCHIARQADPPDERAKEIPKVLSSIVMKLLAKTAEDRYQTAAGVEADLERCLTEWEAQRCIAVFPLGTRDLSERLLIPEMLYGREREINTLLAAFERVAAHGATELVLVSGYSGIGKSSVVNELHKVLVPRCGLFASGKFDQYKRDIPYATLAQAFQSLVRPILGQSEAELGLWRDSLQEALGPNGALIINLVPELELIIGKQSPVAALSPQEMQKRFQMVFRRFVAVFARQEHPLVLFLDDLQWQDAATLDVLKHLITHPEMQYLLLVGAYRDNEVRPSDPLMRTIDEVRKSRVPVCDVVLKPLARHDIERLIADSLHCELERAQPLARMVQEKTDGNPFFVIQFISALAEEDLIAFDRSLAAWSWDLARIRAKGFTDNVVDLMVGKLNRLPAKTQDALKLLACLGNTTEIAFLTVIQGEDEAAIDSQMWDAVRAGLVFRLDQSYAFLHDRVQEAAYSLIPFEQRTAVHLRIGRCLVAAMSSEKLTEHVFDVVNQFNHGAALLSDPNEIERTADLNLRAGRRAKASTAYASACRYFSSGMALLGASGWTTCYDLAFSLTLERAECTFLSSQFDQAEGLIAELLRRADSKIAKAAAYRLKIELHVVKSENSQAVDSALECLRLFGIDMPAHPSRHEVHAEYEEIWRHLGDRSIENLIDLPRSTSPEAHAAMRVLATLISPAFWTDPNLFELHVCKMVNLSLRQGTTDASTTGYAWLGWVLCYAFHRYDEGYRFGKLALDLIERRGFVVDSARVHYAMGLIVSWIKPLPTSIGFFRTAFRTSVETGDHSFINFSASQIIMRLILTGMALDEIWRESVQFMEIAKQTGFRDGTDLIVSQQRFIAAARGQTASLSTFNDTEFDESAFEAELTADRMTTMACWYWILKLETLFLSGEYERALETAEKAKQLLWATPGEIQVLDYHFYSALTLASLAANIAPEQRGEWRTRIMEHRQQFREWALNCPDTFESTATLVDAEVARIDGEHLAAERLYEEAIRMAHQQGFIQNEGIANELAARFYAARGFETIAQAYLRNARHCYLRWGAWGKVRQLDERTPQLRDESISSGATAPGNVAQLDLLSVAKASQAISGQIVLEDLVDTLMRIVLENAGAQTGHLLLARNQSLVLAAAASVEQQAIRVRHLNQALLASTLPESLLRESVLPESALSASIINYVRRSQERVLLDDAMQANPFSTDGYFARRQSKSVLCLPIMRRSALIGLLYLENNLATHAFTPERLTVLELLASQAAISLENALLYVDLQQENSERRRADKALHEREARIRRLGDSNIIGQLFWDVSGNVSEANDAFLQMVGYSRQDLLSGQIRWTDMTPPEYCAADAQALEEILRTGTFKPFEKEYVRKDGRRIPVLVGGALLEGSRENGVAFLLDLTERKAAEAERAARRIAEAANQAKNAFLANMSHELRTPLNGILGYAQILRRSKALEQRDIEGLNVIEHSGEQLLTLINDILDFAKIEAGKLELNLTDFALSKFLRLIAEIIDVRARQKGLEFVADIAPDLPRGIRADESRLRQVLLNLLANAVKFTDQGRVSLRVRFAPPARLRFEVIDTGIGVGADHLETIFQPFEQVSDQQRRLGGAGLGLAISRRFVRLMGSDIHVTSEVGVGSTFWFELELPVVETEARLPERLVTGYEGPRKTVLVVDDVAANRAMAVDMLSQLGFDVVEAINGPEALRQAQALPPDWILTDIVMPEMDGLELTRRLRQLPGLADVPIIAMSASASGVDEQKSLEAGAKVFVPKPIDMGRLLTHVATLLKLNWTYEPRAGSSVEVEVIAPLVAPPQHELETLYQLARMGNMRDIVQWAGTVVDLDERYRPFADQLRLLAKGYQSKAILNLVKRHLETRLGA